ETDPSSNPVASVSTTIYFDEVPLLGGTSDGTTVNRSDLSFNAALPSGGLPDGVKVALYMDGTKVDTQTATNNQTPDFTLPANIAPGQHTFTAVTLDDQGVASDSSSSATVNVRPPAPSIASPLDGASLNQS